jgi:hypothetical protein
MGIPARDETADQVAAYIGAAVRFVMHTIARPVCKNQTAATGYFEVTVALLRRSAERRRRTTEAAHTRQASAGWADIVGVCDA